MSSDNIRQDSSVPAGEEIDAPLSPETLAFLHGIVSGYATHTIPVSSAASPISNREWVAYLTGTMAAEHAENLARQVIRDSALRQQLRDAFRELQAAQRQPLANAARDSVAEAWYGLVLDWTTRTTSMVTQRMDAGWEWLRDQVNGGSKEALALWMVFQADVRRRSAGNTPEALAVALARGGRREQGRLPVVNGEQTEVRVQRAWVAANGTVSIAVTWEQAAPEGQDIFLGMRGAVGGWLLASHPCANGACSWEIPQLGTALALPTGELLLEGFYLSIGAFAEMTDGEFLVLPTPVFTDDEVPIGDVFLRAHTIEVWGGELRLVFVVSEDMRRQYANFRLCLNLQPAPGLTQRLGQWSLAKWESDSLSVSVPLPEVDARLLPTLLGTALYREK